MRICLKKSRVSEWCHLINDIMVTKCYHKLDATILSLLNTFLYGNQNLKRLGRSVSKNITPNDNRRDVVGLGLLQHLIPVQNKIIDCVLGNVHIINQECNSLLHSLTFYLRSAVPIAKHGTPELKRRCS